MHQSDRMNHRQGVVVSLVEHGWRAARVCSLERARVSLEFLHVLKGTSAPSLRELVPPRPYIGLMAIHRHLYWPGVAGLLAIRLLQGRLRLLLVDNPRAVRRLGWFGRIARLPVWQIEWSESGYTLWDRKRRLPETVWNVWR